ncbi:MAG: TetR/AcrR family transcriptional regulator [Pseudomonadota bacterium]
MDHTDIDRAGNDTATPADETERVQMGGDEPSGSDDGGQSGSEGGSRGYHHGDLKSALIRATIDLIREKRLEDVSVADAARRARVSSGAPYRHFKDRDDLIAHVAAEGFMRLSEAERVATVHHPVGTVDRIIALGCSYTEFGVDNHELFHVMWSAARHENAPEVARIAGEASYRGVIQEFSATMAAQGLGHLDPNEFGAPLWAMVHGFSSLLIVRPKMLRADRDSVRKRIADATRAYFLGHAVQAVDRGTDRG